MKPEEIESYKFQAESLKQLGFALCTPFAIVSVKFFAFEMKLVQIVSDSRSFVFISLFIAGLRLILRSVEIMIKLREVN